MGAQCVTKVEASKLLGVSLRMITKYLKGGKLTVHHTESRKVMIDVSEVYNLRKERTERKRGN